MTQSALHLKELASMLGPRARGATCGRGCSLRGTVTAPVDISQMGLRWAYKEECHCGHLRLRRIAQAKPQFDLSVTAPLLQVLGWRGISTAHDRRAEIYRHCRRNLKKHS